MTALREALQMSDSSCKKPEESSIKKKLKILYLLCAVLLVAFIEARPDSGGHVPLPGPGLSYGGIPYGSVSGNVAEYFRRGPSFGQDGNFVADDYQRLDQYL